MMGIEKYKEVKDDLPVIEAPHLIDSVFRSFLVQDEEKVAEFKRVMTTEKMKMDPVAVPEVTPMDGVQGAGTVIGAKERRVAKRMKKKFKAMRRKSHKR